MSDGCISFDSYIKPQQPPVRESPKHVVYLLIPTSNHNYATFRKSHTRLYIFWFLHQTTTNLILLVIHISCISFDSYIKPQRRTGLLWHCPSCISFDSYIKPQHWTYSGCPRCVVYLLIPTSNHNTLTQSSNAWLLYIFWFLHQTTTLQ